MPQSLLSQVFQDEEFRKDYFKRSEQERLEYLHKFLYDNDLEYRNKYNLDKKVKDEIKELDTDYNNFYNKRSPEIFQKPQEKVELPPGDDLVRRLAYGTRDAAIQGGAGFLTGGPTGALATGLPAFAGGFLSPSESPTGGMKEQLLQALMQGVFKVPKVEKALQKAPFLGGVTEGIAESVVPVMSTEDLKAMASGDMSKLSSPTVLAGSLGSLGGAVSGLSRRHAARALPTKVNEFEDFVREYDKQQGSLQRPINISEDVDKYLGKTGKISSEEEKLKLQKKYSSQTLSAKVKESENIKTKLEERSATSLEAWIAETQHLGDRVEILTQELNERMKAIPQAKHNDDPIIQDLKRQLFEDRARLAFVEKQGPTKTGMEEMYKQKQLEKQKARTKLDQANERLGTIGLTKDQLHEQAIDLEVATGVDPDKFTRGDRQFFKEALKAENANDFFNATIGKGLGEQSGNSINSGLKWVRATQRLFGNDSPEMKDLRFRALKRFTELATSPEGYDGKKLVLALRNLGDETTNALFNSPKAYENLNNIVSGIAVAQKREGIIGALKDAGLSFSIGAGGLIMTLRQFETSPGFMGAAAVGAGSVLGYISWKKLMDKAISSKDNKLSKLFLAAATGQGQVAATAARKLKEQLDKDED